jgi:hypothetical protein
MNKSYNANAQRNYFTKDADTLQKYKPLTHEPTEKKVK